MMSDFKKKYIHIFKNRDRQSKWAIIEDDSTKLAEDVTEEVEEAVEIIGGVKEVIAKAVGIVFKFWR